MKICLNLTASQDDKFSGPHSQQVLHFDVPDAPGLSTPREITDTLADIAIALFGPESP